MTNDEGLKPEGAPERSPKVGAGAPSGVDGKGPKRFSVQRKMAIVARLLRCELADHTHPNSTRSKMYGNICAATNSRSQSSKATMISSTRLATPGHTSVASSASFAASSRRLKQSALTSGMAALDHIATAWAGILDGPTTRLTSGSSASSRRRRATAPPGSLPASALANPSANEWSDLKTLLGSPIKRLSHDFARKGCPAAMYATKSCSRTTPAPAYFDHGAG
jgi:hypothetical protein